MPQRALRFGIRDDAGRRSATWKLWTEAAGGKSEVYLACRSLGGTVKASLHESGKWHIAYSQTAFEERVRGEIPELEDRYIEKWPRPFEFTSGITLAFRIVTPWSAVKNPVDGSNLKGVTWLPNAPKQMAMEIDILITKPTNTFTGWPGKRSMGTVLIGSIPLENSETVWAVYWVVKMPDSTSLGKGAGRFYKGRNERDLHSEGLRALIFGKEPDGSIVIYDCAAETTRDSLQLISGDSTQKSVAVTNNTDKGEGKMAIQECTECGKNVSTTAKFCPHCGAQTSGENTVARATSAARIVLMVMAIFSIMPAFILGGCLGLIVPAILFILALLLK